MTVELFLTDNILLDYVKHRYTFKQLLSILITTENERHSIQLKLFFELTIFIGLWKTLMYL